MNFTHIAQAIASRHMGDPKLGLRRELFQRLLVSRPRAQSATRTHAVHTNRGDPAQGNAFWVSLMYISPWTVIPRNQKNSAREYVFLPCRAFTRITRLRNNASTCSVAQNARLDEAHKDSKNCWGWIIQRARSTNSCFEMQN